jgi:hypothetical protein
MRNLNLIELNEVEGGAMALRWAFRMGEVFSEAYTFYQATSEFRFDTSGYGRPSGSGFNAMGDFSF